MKFRASFGIKIFARAFPWVHLKYSETESSIRMGSISFAFQQWYLGRANICSCWWAVWMGLDFVPQAVPLGSSCTIVPHFIIRVGDPVTCSGDVCLKHNPTKRISNPNRPITFVSTRWSGCSQWDCWFRYHLPGKCYGHVRYTRHCSKLSSNGLHGL
jgi:hypothetical protein